MPLPIMLAHKLTRRLAECRKEGLVDFLRPDGKSQVTVEYHGDKPVRVDAVVLSTQHDEVVKHKTLREAMMETVVAHCIPRGMLDNKTKIHINPTGRFVHGGPYADSGVTGRKIIVDTYGGMGRHGGGAFSGKDPSKVDRSAAYYARYIAKNIVAAKLARRCEVQIAYAIGVAQPVGAYVDTFGTGAASEDKIAAYVMKNFDMRPKAIIETLDLLRPIYKATAAYGHFGRVEKTCTWEKTDRAAELADALLPAKGKASGDASKSAKAGNGNGHKTEKKPAAKRAARGAALHA
jgi:S-adenosylmethionine synthetase